MIYTTMKSKLLKHWVLKTMHGIAISIISLGIGGKISSSTAMMSTLELLDGISIAGKTMHQRQQQKTCIGMN